MTLRRFGAGAGRDCTQDSGAVAIVVAAFMVVVMALAALVVDLGFARDRVRIAQNAADAAALGVAMCFAASSGCGDPTGTAQKYITANGWTYDPSTVKVDPTAQTVTVALPAQATPSFFAGALGLQNPAVSATARATWNGAASLLCALCVLGGFDGQIGDITLAGSLVVGGNLAFNNRGGTVTINGPANAGVYYHGTRRRGTYTVNGATVTPINVGQQITDPLASLPLPPPTGAEGVDLTKPATFGPGSGTCQPGNYIDFSKCTSLAGNGIYIVTGTAGGEAVTIPGTSGSNTLVYLTCAGAGNAVRSCNPREKGAYLGGKGNFSTTVNGRTTGAYQGYAIIYDRNDAPAAGDVKVTGNSTITLNGNLYGASAAVDFRGNGSMTVTGFAVVGSVMLSGNGAAKNHVDVQAQGGMRTIPGATSPHLVP